ncbi:hypothetical protein QT972_17945 [Microcoleus sp. herbarium7]|uniref:hypothetical protein n=1 Tax=Microcoleus sp. herbarium7 TaxID=3055435 RepID=UPI002FCEAFC5
MSLQSIAVGGHGSAVSLQLMGVGKRLLECPLYHSGAAGIDISHGFSIGHSLEQKYNLADRPR